jgi:hypothetical protein
MRRAIQLAILLVTCSNCSPAMRQVGLNIKSSHTPVPVFDTDTAKSPAFTVAREVLDGWNFLYLNITETEFALCLEGRNVAGRLEITAFRLAHVIASHSSAVEYVPCAGDSFVGTAHNHLSSDYPGMDPCYQSGKDLQSFKKDSKALVDIVICGRDRFVWDLKDGKDPRVWSMDRVQPNRK